MTAHILRFTAAAILLAGASGCAGATLGSGVGDRSLEHPPWYAGSGAAAPGAGLRHLPVAYQRGGSGPAQFDPAADPGSPMADLLAEMNAHLDSPGLSAALPDAPPAGALPPDVRFGCDTDASGDCVGPADRPGDIGDPVMRLAVGRPNATWTEWAGAALGPSDSLLLVLTIEVGQYLPRQTGISGAKAVELGTGHTVRLPWLTSLETPVSVIQLTGALVGRDGRARRIGAEGMLARRTGLAASGFGLQALIRDEDVAALRTARRDDLPGRPLVWRAALDSLLAGLTGRPVAAP